MITIIFHSMFSPIPEDCLAIFLIIRPSISIIINFLLTLILLFVIFLFLVNFFSTTINFVISLLNI